MTERGADPDADDATSATGGTTSTAATTPAVPAAPAPEGALGVFRNPSFLRLWLSQAATQIGGNMVLFGLTVIVSETQPNTAVSLLILSFLVPAVLFSAVAGVYVDRVDRRLVLVTTNVLRGIAIIGLFLVGDNFLLLLLLNIFVSTVTVFFAPAEAAMIPEVVPREQLLAANGVFTLTLNAAFALGFALLGPLVINIAGPQAVILVVAALYLLAAVFCWTLPASPPPAALEAQAVTHAVGETQKAVESTVAQLREGLSFIRTNRSIGWSLLYLGITASLVGVLGVLGPDFAQTALGLKPKDFAIIVLPLGGGIVMGILLLNSYGKFLPRRRVIEGGLILLGIMLALLSVAGPLSMLLQNADRASSLIDLSALTSLLAIVVFIAFIAGVAYGAVAIPSQTQLQEDLPEDVRGRVFGVLNMLVSVSSFLPIIVVGPISDLIGTATVLLVVAIGVLAAGVASVLGRDPNLGVAGATADPHVEDPLAAALGADRPRWRPEPGAPSSPLRSPGIVGPSDPADRD
ncbi:MAG TPA: MFS transporter [Candidatus Limnocylindrales bacterium]|nr:MFS transporter [Candidatus Limnocylindrales bacterium]